MKRMFITLFVISFCIVSFSASQAACPAKELTGQELHTEVYRDLSKGDPDLSSLEKALVKAYSAKTKIKSPSNDILYAVHIALAIELQQLINAQDLVKQLSILVLQSPNVEAFKDVALRVIANMAMSSEPPTLASPQNNSSTTPSHRAALTPHTNNQKPRKVTQQHGKPFHSKTKHRNHYSFNRHKW